MWLGIGYFGIRGWLAKRATTRFRGVRSLSQIGKHLKKIRRANTPGYSATGGLAKRWCAELAGLAGHGLL